jgi:ubiquinone/menaquinone biosynthesis C-methylase UbiE
MVDRADPGPKECALLVDLLRCPSCSAGMSVAEDWAVCKNGSQHRFPVVEGVLLLIRDEELARDPQYDHQRRYFNDEFARYNSYRPDLWRASYLRRLRAGAVLGAPDAPLIDVGVGGSGHTVIEAARAGSPAVGCDLSLEGLVVARRFAATEGVEDRTLWVCCSAEKLPFATGAFGSALAIAVIEHVPDDLAALSEVARVLRSGGRAWVTVPHALRNIAPIFRPSNRRHDRLLGHLRRYEADSLVEAGRRFGLEPVDIQYTGHAIKVLQFVASKLLLGVAGRRLWWWCEARDLRRSNERRGSMQLSVLFSRGGP